MRRTCTCMKGAVVFGLIAGLTPGLCAQPLQQQPTVTPSDGTDAPRSLLTEAQQTATACPWDLDGNNDVGVGDLLILLAAWGPNPGHPADFDGNDDVGVSDLLVLLANWGPCPECLPQPLIILPQNEAVLTDIALIIAEQVSECLSPFDINVASFEYSIDGVDWFQISIQTDLDDVFKGLGPGIWDTGWDVEALASGTYLVRVTMETFEGLAASSDPVLVIVNKAPIASATAVQDEPGLVTFDGTASFDRDGFIESWSWEFGDGTVGSGEVVEHFYKDLKQAYTVVLTVEDDLATTASEYYTLTFAFPRFSFRVQNQPKCTCTSVTLRGDNLPAEAMAFGPDGKAGGKDWPKTNDNDDGKTLGPLHNNPENKVIGGEKKYTGYAFEVLFVLNGRPSRCDEIQVVRLTTVYKGYTMAQCTTVGGTWNAANSTCTAPIKWTGSKKDLDLDGTNDIDVATQAKCETAGGTWNAATMKCTLAFPQSGTKYGPDVPSDDLTKDPQGAYERKFRYKNHTTNHKIIWYDTPQFGSVMKGGATVPAKGTTFKADFIAIVRGTDDSYCYVAFTVAVERKTGQGNAGQDTETLNQTRTGAGVVSVPGVP